MEIKRKHESIFWVAVWGIVFLIVPLTVLGQLFSPSSLEALRRVLTIWKGILPFLLLFVVHHIFLAPLAWKRNKLYVSLTFLLLMAFCLYCHFIGPNPEGPPLGIDKPKGPIRPQTMKAIMGVLLVQADLGAYSYVEILRNKQRIASIMAESVAAQLEALRYQINPHFFMNTLNNIHALVDIDPEKAKESIEEFSKMMRILLYEGHTTAIPLEREVAFIEHYISLMGIRYSDDSIEIDASLPSDCSGYYVPPLFSASIIENAFKHGISYDEPSFIHIVLTVDTGRILFRCSNSIHRSLEQSPHGLGLDNLRKRLALTYGDAYTIISDDSQGEYSIRLELPAQPPIQRV